MANQRLHTTLHPHPHHIPSRATIADHCGRHHPQTYWPCPTLTTPHSYTKCSPTTNKKKMTFQLSHQLATLEIETISVSIASVVRKFHFKPQFYLFIFVPFFSIGSLWRQCNGFWLVFCVWFCYLFIFWIVVVVGIVVKRGFNVTVKTKHAFKVIRTWRSSR